MTINHETQKANEGKLRTVAIAVAAALGEGWKLEDRERDYNHYCEIEQPSTGARLGLSTSEGKVHITGRFVEYVDYEVNGRAERDHVFYRNSASPNVSIGCSIDKRPEVIAADIKRRLFPAYLPEWQRNLEAIDRHNAHDRVTKSNADLLAGLIGGKATKRGYHFQVNVYHSEHLAGSTFDIKVSETEVTFDHLSVPVAVAGQILAILKQNQKPVEVEV